MDTHICQYCGQTFTRKRKSHDFVKFCSRACASRFYAEQRPRVKKQCCVDACNNDHYAKGYCKRHYRQILKHGHIVMPKNIAGYRRCSICKEYKLENSDNFGQRKACRNGVDTICRECRNKEAKRRRQSNDYRERYYKKNKDTILAKSREAYYKNKEERNAKQREWYNKNKVDRNKKIKEWQEKNRDRYLELRRNLERKYRSKDPRYAISQRISAGMRRFLRDGKKGKSWVELVDFTPEQLVEHIERLFKPGMTWENRDQWHIDHIKPVSAFTFQSADDPQVKECWSLNNLQPLWATDNIRKSNHYARKNQRLSSCSKGG